MVRHELSLPRAGARAGHVFEGGTERYFEGVRDAHATGSARKPVLIGPVTYLWLSKSRITGFDRLELMPALLLAYRRILARLREAGVEWVQLDEPALVHRSRAALARRVGKRLRAAREYRREDHVATISAVSPTTLPEVAQLPVQGIHLDFVRAPGQLEVSRSLLPEGAVLSAGLIDGRNVWRTDLAKRLPGRARSRGAGRAPVARAVLLPHARSGVARAGVVARPGNAARGSLSPREAR